VRNWRHGWQPGWCSLAPTSNRRAPPKWPCLAACCLQNSGHLRVARFTVFVTFPRTLSSPSSSILMSPLVRTPNQCCINKAIQHLSFDPSLQDSAWHRAQARPKPYNSTDRDRCPRKTEKGDVVCDAEVLDVLDTLGVPLDPTARTVATKQKPPVKRESSPSPSLDHLAHKNLYISGKQSKVRSEGCLKPAIGPPLTASSRAQPPAQNI
jgi:hypothetical protein